MRACVVSCLLPRCVNNGGSVAATCYTVVNKQLQDYCFAFICTKVYIFSPAARSVPSQSICCWSSITACVLDKTLGTDICCMECCCLLKFLIPSQRTHRSHALKERYGFIHSSNSFVGNYTSTLTCWSPNIALEFSCPLLKLRNERCGVSSNRIGSFKDCYVNSWYSSWHTWVATVSTTVITTTIVGTARNDCRYSGRVDGEVCWSSCRNGLDTWRVRSDVGRVCRNCG